MLLFEYCVFVVRCCCYSALLDVLRFCYSLCVVVCGFVVCWFLVSFVAVCYVSVVVRCCLVLIVCCD